MKKFLCFTAIILMAALTFQIFALNAVLSRSNKKVKTITSEYAPENTMSSLPKTDYAPIPVQALPKKKAYTLPSVITTKDEWLKALNYCSDNLIKSASFEIRGFDEKVYDLKTLTLVNTSIQAKGTLKNTTANLTYTFTYKENYILNKAAENPKFISQLTNEQLNLFNKLKKISSSIIKPQMTDFEKEKAIHDYIVLNSAYSKNITKNSYNVRNLITKGTGVCEAYAYIFQILCSFSGIECNIITGTLNGESHGWNLVKLDGEYYHVDVTSDDPVPDKKGEIHYTFFNVNDNEIAKTHVWNRESFPKCTATKYNYYVYYNLIVETPKQMEKLIMKNLEKGAEAIHFYVKNFTIKSTSDFLFCGKGEKDLTSFYVSGKFGSGGAFLFRPTYAK